MLFKGGYLRLGRFSGAPVRAHWTIPLAAFIFGRGRIVPGFWLGFALLVLVHELGHAVVVRRCHLRVVSVDVHALGGVCQWAGEATAIQSARIAWGGILAQLWLFLGTLAALAVLGPVRDAFTAGLTDAFTETNLFMMALNLLPVASFDGAEAWKLPGLLRARRRARAGSHEARAQHAAKLELVRLDASERDAPLGETAAAVEAKLRELAGGPKKPS